MKNVVTLDETIEVRRPLHEVFAYVSEFSSIEQWDPGVARAHKITEGLPRAGSQYCIDMKGGFSLHYRLVELETDRRMAMTVDSRFFTAREEILFSGTGTGTKVRYIAKFDFPKPLARAHRCFPAAMQGVADGTMEGLRQALEDNFDPPPASRRIALADRLVVPGLWRFTKLGYRASRRHWNPMSARLEGRHALITGATSGLGLAAARALAGMGARVTLVARNAAKAKQVASQLQRQTGNLQIAVEVTDMSLIADVNALADRLLAADRPIDMLINNAGALFNPRQETSEGLEKSFALLLLAPYVLTERLHPLLLKSASPRVINVSSGGMYSQKIRADDLQYRRGRYSGSAAYARAKRALMIVTEHWANEWSADGIAVNAMHPGWADTPGVEHALPLFYRATRPLLRSPAEGADTIVWLAASTEAGNVSGKFWLDREPHPTHLVRRTRETRDERKQLLRQLQQLMTSGPGS